MKNKKRTYVNWHLVETVDTHDDHLIITMASGRMVHTKLTEVLDAAQVSPRFKRADRLNDDDWKAHRVT